jgi:hypothetical protein
MRPVPSALLVACLLFCLLTCPSAPAAAAGGDPLQLLARDFWAWRAAGQPFSGDDVPRVLRPPGWTPDWSAPAVAARRHDLARFESRWRALASPGRPVAEQVDRRLLGSALARVRWELDGVRLWRRDPGFYLAQTLGALVLRAFHDSVWRNGNVPLALQRWELLGLGDQVAALDGK